MLLEQITLRNLLSFRDATIALGPLNILIGENTAGKSNLIEAISLLQALPTDLQRAVQRGGGIHFLLWLGAPSPQATLGCTAVPGPGEAGVTYELEFSEELPGMVISRETLFGGSGERYFDRVHQSADFGSAKGYPI